MKPSPLQLNYIVYPKLSVEALPAEGDTVASALIESQVSVRARVSYKEDGEHTVIVSITHDETQTPRAYDFAVEVFARFAIDNGIAREVYKGERFPVDAAIDVSRVLFSGARELLATVSARSPYGALSLPSVILGLPDVSIRFERDPADLVPALFGVPFESLGLKLASVPRKVTKAPRKTARRIIEANPLDE